MRSDRIALLIGSMAYFHAPTQEYDPELRHCGVDEHMWKLTTTERRWRGAEKETVRRALDGILTAGLAVSGVARFALPVEFLAALIASTVKPVNWMASVDLVSAGLDGTRLIAQNGDQVAAREYVSPERLFALVLVAHDLRSQSFNGKTIGETVTQAEADLAEKPAA